MVEDNGGLDAYTLELLTHREDPWINARKGLAVGEPSSTVIDEDDMRRFYRSRLEAQSEH